MESVSNNDRFDFGNRECGNNANTENKSKSYISFYYILASCVRSFAINRGKGNSRAVNSWHIILKFCIDHSCMLSCKMLRPMMTSSNGNSFRVTGHLCGEFTGPRWIPRTKASDAGLWCFFDLRPDKRLSKQSWGWWLETPSHSLWRHRNADLSNVQGSKERSRYRGQGEVDPNYTPRYLWDVISCPCPRYLPLVHQST